MNTKLSTLVLIACLGSSLAFAGSKNKSKHAMDDANTTAQPAAASAKQGQESTSSAKSNKMKMKKKARPAPSKQEQEFDEVLRGIYG